MREIKNREEFDQAVASDRNSCAMFTADWCPDCQVLKPVLPELVAEFEDFDFISLNRDEFIDLCQEQNVFGIPSFITFRKGEETGRFVSKDRKTKEEIVDFLKKSSL